jgi:branched-chain amino acid transport system ATP-binding protein
MLSVRELSVSYGHVDALRGCSLEVPAGAIVTLLGANGAGKTTVLHAIAGLVKPGAGTITFEGRPLPRDPAAVVRLGISLVPEHRQLFPAMTVAENLRLGAYTRGMADGGFDDVFALFPELALLRDSAAAMLSGGQQQMLAIGRALMSRPRLLLLDEPSMGLAPLMVEKIFDTVRMVSEEGVTVLLVEQNAKLALEASHRGYVMESGLITLADGARALLDNPLVRRAYLGE